MSCMSLTIGQRYSRERRNWLAAVCIITSHRYLVRAMDRTLARPSVNKCRPVGCMCLCATVYTYARAWARDGKCLPVGVRVVGIKEAGAGGWTGPLTRIPQLLQFLRLHSLVCGVCVHARAREECARARACWCARAPLYARHCARGNPHARARLLDIRPAKSAPVVRRLRPSLQWRRDRGS